MTSSSSQGGAAAVPGGAGAGGGASGSAFVSLSSALLAGLDALRLDAEVESPTASGSGAQQQQQRRRGPFGFTTAEQQPRRREGAGAGSDKAGQQGPAVQLVPDPRRGTLRLLQATKEPERLKLVWSPLELEVPAGRQQQQQQPGPGPAGEQGQQPPFNMFAAAAPDSQQVSTAGSWQAGAIALTGLLGTLSGDGPATAAAAAGPTKPIQHRGTEFWEPGSKFELELEPLRAEGEVNLRSISARALPNGAQLLLVSAAPGQWRGGGVGGGRSSGGRGGGCTAFWLQQAWADGCVLVPPEPAAEAEEGVSDGNGSEQQGEEGQPAVGPAAGSSSRAAVAAAAALAELMVSPPAVDVRQLRCDIKDGTLQVCDCGRVGMSRLPLCVLLAWNARKRGALLSVPVSCGKGAPKYNPTSLSHSHSHSACPMPCGPPCALHRRSPL